MLAFCLGEMALPPDAVWRSTPREVAAMLAGRRGRGGAAAPTRTEFDDLLRRFPDGGERRTTQEGHAT